MPAWRSDPDRQAAVGDDDGAGDEAGGVARQQDRNAFEIVRHTKALNRRFFDDVIYRAADLVGTEAGHHLGMHQTGQHRVDLDIVLAPGAGEALGHVVHATLGRRVVHQLAMAFLGDG